MARKKVPQTLGGRLRAARENSSLSAKDVASRLGVKAQSVTAWENDQSEPRANKVLLLAGLLNVSVTWLLEGSGQGLQKRSIELELEEVGGQIEAARAQLDRLSSSLDATCDKLSVVLERVRAARQQAS